MAPTALEPASPRVPTVHGPRRSGAIRHPADADGVGASTYTYNDYDLNPDPPHQPMYLDKVLRQLRSDRSIRRVLDAGCGDGNFAASLADAGYEMFGLDLSGSGIRIASRRNVGRFQEASVYDDLTAPFAGVSSFDAIVGVEVVEHLYSPRTFVRQAFDALRPGGLLIVTTPYWGYAKNLGLALTNRMDTALTALWDGGHIKHWSRKTLSSLIAEQSFEVVGFDGAGRPIPYLWNGMVMTGRKPAEHADEGR
jgi:2-polyprenyl-6-hydroxyphenyl methylase/3-demethylubiquinone-9 3-methyltransferase